MMFRTEYDEFGREIPDPRPMAVPAGYDRPLSLAEQIKRMVRIELSRSAEAEGLESFEEADDFDVPEDEGDFVSPYEVREMAQEAPGGVPVVDPDPPTQAGEKTPVEPAKASGGAPDVGA